MGRSWFSRLIGALALLLPAGVLAQTDASAPSDALPGADARPTDAAPAAPTETAAQRARTWARPRVPTLGPPRAFGGYSNGCLQGAVALPPSGPGFEVLHLKRNRRYGHPALVAYLQRLAAAVKRDHLGMLLVGDLSQPRGGPTLTGHKSHQSGLDADVAYTLPAGLLGRKLTPEERETIYGPPVVDLAKRALTPAWNPKVPRILALAAGDPDVERIFVHAAVKRELCTKLSPRPPWLQKIRPWHAHHDHFHVRLRCPAEDKECLAQDPIPAGDGCDALGWWFEDHKAEPAPPGPPPPPPPLPAMPEGCATVLAGETVAPVQLSAGRR